MKIRNYLGLIAVLLICVACPNDDDDGIITVPPRDRGEQSIADDEVIMEYLATHFYNYEEFENPPTGFDYKIRFDTISDDNSDKTPILDREELKVKIYDRFDTQNKLYILQVRQGAAEEPVANYTDSTLVQYTGSNLGGDTFDASPSPVWFDLPSTINGFSNGLGTSVGLDASSDPDGNVGFRGGSSFTVNPDGTTEFSQDYGIGAVFIPSGLAYFNQPPPGIELYGPLVFTFSVYDVKITDHDGDGILSINEDLDMNGFLFDEEDNPDEDQAFAYADPDDDNDRVQTRLEIVLDAEGNFLSYLDTDGDGLSNHLDDDDDGDGRSTLSEIVINATTGEVTFPDEDGDGTPDYLDPDN